MTTPIIVLGSGITGLATAYVLSLSSKYSITIIARDLPGDENLAWASPWAGAVFHPQKQATPAQQTMQAASFNIYSSLAHSDPSSGVVMYPMTEYFDDDDESSLWYKILMPDYRIIPTEELPSGVSFGVKYTSLALNPGILLPWLKEKLLGKGVRFIRSEVTSFSEALKKVEGSAAGFLVNATGVGARELAGDDAVRPVRGQTMFVQTDFSELVMREGKEEYTYVIPRPGAGGVIMGGIKSERLDGEVDVLLKSDILRRVNRITGGRFEGVDLGKVMDIVGFRPGRKSGLRVEREGRIIHAYGAEGAGYIYSFGVAERVKELIEGVGALAKL